MGTFKTWFLRLPLAEGGTMLRGPEDEDRDEAMTDAGEDTSEDSSDEDAE
jgi:hypothetical protein